MSLDTAGLKTDLKTLYTATSTGDGSAEDQLDAFLDSMVAAFAKFVKSAEIVYTDGLTAPDGPVTGEFNGELQ